MVRKPLTFFVLLAASGNRLFKAVAQRHHTTGVQELSPRSRLQAAQLLGDITAVCVVPVTSVFRGRILGLSPPDIAQEACLGLFLALLSAWLCKYILPYRNEAFSAKQPTKGACPTESSPQNGLKVSSVWALLQWLSRPWQRRRLYLHKALSLLQGIDPFSVLCGSLSPLAARMPRSSAPGSHGVHDWHEALPAGFLMPLEVAACRSPPEVSSAIQRLLADRWWDLEGGVPMLEPVPEDECLTLDELPLENLRELLEMSA